MSSSRPPLRRRIGCGALLALVAAGPAGCGENAVVGGADETISTGEGQAVIPKQELINLGAAEKSLAPPTKKAR
jgi:hypothetical protein